MKRPNTCTNLMRAIRIIANGEDDVRLSRALANVIIGQMLPDGVVKGGSSLMFRYGTKLIENHFFSMHRREGDVDFFFVAGEGSGDVELNASCEGRTVEIWDAVKCGRARCPHRPPSRRVKWQDTRLARFADWRQLLRRVLWKQH